MRRLIILGVLCFLVASVTSKADTDSFSNILFLHHSTGANLITQGGVRSSIADYNSAHNTHLEFWDHGYNGDGVHDQNGNFYSNYNIPGDNTNPDGFYTLFTQPLHNPPDNAFSRIMLSHLMGDDTVTHEVFIFKSCFPASDISSEQMLQNYQTWYLAIRDIMDQHPEKLFIPFTPPPLTRSSTTVENAARAQRFADWLTSAEYLNGHLNIFIFNFRNYLMEHDSLSYYYNCLREAYGGSGGDSHPNQLANQTVGPIFVEFITAAIESYSGLQHNGPGNPDILPPGMVSILGNYPNPFNSAVEIRYYLSSEADVSFEVFDIAGKRVDSVAMGIRGTGQHTFIWQANDLASGVYIYCIKAGLSADFEKMLYIK